MEQLCALVNKAITFTECKVNVKECRTPKQSPTYCTFWRRRGNQKLFDSRPQFPAARHHDTQKVSAENDEQIAGNGYLITVKLCAGSQMPACKHTETSHVFNTPMSTRSVSCQV